MDIIVKQSGGHNVVLRPQALPRWYPPPTTEAATADVYWRFDDEPPNAARWAGTFNPGATGSIPYNPVADQNVVLSVITHSAYGTPDVGSLDDAVSATLLFERSTTDPALDSVDNGVPVVTKPPTIARVDGADQWAVYIPLPDSLGYSTNNCQVEISKASDGSIIRSPQIGFVTYWTTPMAAFDCKIRYRWRNSYRAGPPTLPEDDGWSAWSPYADAYGLGSPNVANLPPETDLTTFDNDEGDVFNPHIRDSQYGT